jgi:hypothetical protein
LPSRCRVDNSFSGGTRSRTWTRQHCRYRREWNSPWHTEKSRRPTKKSNSSVWRVRNPIRRCNLTIHPATSRHMPSCAPATSRASTASTGVAISGTGDRSIGHAARWHSKWARIHRRSGLVRRLFNRTAEPSSPANEARGKIGELCAHAPHRDFHPALFQARDDVFVRSLLATICG